ncbi:MAG: hypothetical protein ABIB93_01010 [Chloroflexota bacterium]
MTRYIFITHEGYSFQPLSESLEPDIENMQVIGFGQGNDAQDALEDMLKRNEFLAETSFDEVVALKLQDSTSEVLSLKDFLLQRR